MYACLQTQPTPAYSRTHLRRSSAGAKVLCAVGGAGRGGVSTSRASLISARVTRDSLTCSPIVCACVRACVRVLVYVLVFGSKKDLFTDLDRRLLCDLEVLDQLHVLQDIALRVRQPEQQVVLELLQPDLELVILRGQSEGSGSQRRLRV